MGKAIRNFKNKYKGSKLVIFLALISMMGMLFNTIIMFTGYDLSPWFGIQSIILGVGLMIESHFRGMMKRTRKVMDSMTVAKITTFVVGMLVFVGGIISMPFFNFAIEGTSYGGAVGIANAIAFFVIGYQIFFVK